jgi:hypothetical protein
MLISEFHSIISWDKNINVLSDIQSIQIKSIHNMRFQE